MQTAMNRSLVDRAMRVRNWLPYYGSPYTGQRGFYAAVSEARSFEELDPEYQRAILDAEERWRAVRVVGRRRASYFVGLGLLSPLLAASVLYTLAMLFSAAFVPIPAHAVQPPPDVVPLGFVIGVLVAAGLGHACRSLYYGLWPEREGR